MFQVGNAAVGILWRIAGTKQNRLSTWTKIRVEEMEQEFQPLLRLIWPLWMSSSEIFGPSYCGGPLPNPSLFSIPRKRAK